MVLSKIDLPSLSRSNLSETGLSLSELIQASFNRNSERTVLLSSEGSFTFSELQTDALRFTNLLDEEGIPRDACVALCADGGASYVAQAIGCVIRGNPFLPISASDSTARKAKILSRARPGAVVETIDGVTSFSKPTITPRTYLPGTTYILHTSGSTGVPKAIMLEERNLISFCDWYAKTLDFHEESRITFSSKPTFDFSIPEYFLPVLFGGAMICPKRPISASVHEFLREIDSLGVTHLHIVPTLLNYLLQLTKKRRLKGLSLDSLEFVCCNGEPLTGKTTKEFFSQFPNAQLINSYGPTETCVGVTANVMKEGAPGDSVSIGMPGYGTTLLLDAEDGDTEEIKGELVIAGMQVGSGYIDAEERDSRAFFDITVEGFKQRAYRTGDIFRYGKDGGLYFVERRDFQVKYRGVRLELGEVEAACRAYASCDDAVALILERDDDDRAQSLIVFVSPQIASTQGLSEHLARVLPKNSVPDEILSLPSLPTTRNGKKDRRILHDIAREKVWAEDIGNLGRRDNKPNNAPDALKKCLTYVLERDVDLDSILDLRELDSLGLLRLEFWLEEFGYELDLERARETAMSLQLLSELLRPSHIGFRDLAGDGAIVSTDAAKAQLQAVFDAIERSDRDVILVQSSFLGLKVEDPAAFVDFLLEEIERLAINKTVVIPAYTLGAIETGRYHFQESLPETGILANRLLRRSDIVRTKHPVYSYLIFGVRSKEVATSEYWRQPPFGDGSFFAWLSSQNSAALLFGTQALAISHQYESIAGVPYHRLVEKGIEADFGFGMALSTTLVYSRDLLSEPEWKLFGVDLDVLFSTIEPHIKEFEVGGIVVSIVDLPGAERTVVNELRAEPLKLVSSDKVEVAKDYLRSISR